MPTGAGPLARSPNFPLLTELSRGGHKIHLRTLSTGVETGQRLGFVTDAIDPRIEAIVHDDWKAPNIRAALKMAIEVFCRRAVHEVSDFTDAVARIRPDAVIVDVNCWGALSAADAGDIPWLCFTPYTPFLKSPGVPPSARVSNHCPACWAGYATPRYNR